MDTDGNTYTIESTPGENPLLFRFIEDTYEELSSSVGFLLNTILDIIFNPAVGGLLALLLTLLLARFVFQLYHRHILRKRFLQSKTTRIRLVAHRNLCTALIVSPKDGDSMPVGRTMVSYVEQWLTDLGFSVTVINDLSLLSRAVDFTPTVTAIDCRQGAEIARKVDSHFQSRKIPSRATVICFNLENSFRKLRTKYLLNVTTLGRSFNRADIVRSVSPLLVSREVAVPDTSDLQGKIQGHILADILQFMETVSRTGNLLLRDQAFHILGSIQMTGGMVTFAQHHSGCIGEDAIMELLGTTNGYFQLHAEAPFQESNCMVSPTAALLSWAKVSDEKQRGHSDPGFQVSLT